MQPFAVHDQAQALQLLEKISDGTPACVPPLIPGQSVVLYGAGQLGLLALAFCRHVGIEVSCVLDRNAGPGQLLNGEVPVLPPLDFPADPDAAVLVTIVTSPYLPIAGELMDWGWKKVLPFYDYAQNFTAAHPLNNGWFAGALSDEDETNLRAVLEGLDDAHSRAAYLQFLAWRVLRQEWTPTEAPVRMDDKYIIGPVAAALSGVEHFVDVGAYDGRFLLHLLEATGGRFSSARLFEPDPANAALLRQALNRLSAAQRAKIEVTSEAVSDGSGESAFSQGFDMASRLSADGHIRVTTVALDDLGLRPTYLKIHVEGAELQVLRGGAGTLRDSRPIVAVTAYHSRDGLWKLPRLLMETLESYNFYFRLHTWCGTGAVFYAVPQERRLREQGPGTTN